jgi:hypothetical protein
MPARNQENVAGREGRNHHESANPRILFKLIRTKSSKAALGARVTVKAGTQRSSMKCAAARVTLRRKICGCILGWRRMERCRKLRFAGRTAKLKLCAMSRRISFTRWSRAQASAKKWLCLLCHDEPGFSEPDFLNLLFSILRRAIITPSKENLCLPLLRTARFATWRFPR